MQQLFPFFIQMLRFVSLSALLWWIVVNWFTEVPLTLGLDWIIPVPLGIVILGAALLTLGVLAGSLLRTQRKASQNQLQAQWKKEQAEVSAEVASDKVKALEAKIETLETALARSLQR